MGAEEISSFWEEVDQASPGTILFLKQPPLCVNIALSTSSQTAATIPSMEPGRTVIPMTIVKTGNRLRHLRVNKKRGEKIDACGYYDHSVDLAFAVTYHKAQGRTINRVLLSLHDHGRSHITVASFYVGISRVRDSNHLRILPIDTAQRMKLLDLKFADELVQWWRSANI